MQPRISLLTDEKIGEVDFLEFKLYRFNEFGRDKLCCLTAYTDLFGTLKGEIGLRGCSPKAIKLGKSVGPNLIMTESVSP
jgi:hypothetical protein